MTVKKDKALNQWINKQLKIRLIVELSIKFKICSTIFLYSKKEHIIMINTRLQKTESIYDKEQDATTLNWESN